MRRQAFSLVELLLVLATMVVLAGVALPRMGSAQNRQRVDLAAKRLADELRLARQLAIATGASCTLTVNPATHLCTTTPGTGVTAPQPFRIGEWPTSSQVVSSNFGGDTAVVFTTWGDPDSAGAVVLRAGASVRTVRLSASRGLVTVE